MFFRAPNSPCSVFILPSSQVNTIKVVNKCACVSLSSPCYYKSVHNHMGCVCVCVCVRACVCVCVRVCVCVCAVGILLLLLLVPVDGKRRVSLSSQRIPLLLECGHCSLCLQKMSHLQSSDLPCPQCRVRRVKERGREGERGGDESLLCYMYKYMYS